MRDVQRLIDAADVTELLIAVDKLCAAQDWDGLVDLARRCREAVELGKQLWPVATHIDYRLAFEAPGRYAAGVLRPGGGRFALGPLTEVAASTHTWADLAPHLPDPVSAAAVAQERVIRGEDLTGDPHVELAELPLRLAPWEPTYALPSYQERSALFPQPEVATRPGPPPAALPAQPPSRPSEDEVTQALTDVVEEWVAASAGNVQAVAVTGTAAAAVAHLAPAAGLLKITAAEALALLQWAGASGGAHGRRRGGAAGRFAAWWVAAAAADVAWPDDPARLAELPRELGAGLDRLRWYRWRPQEAETGWTLRIAVEDPERGRAWAVDATDRERDDTLDET